MKKDKKGIVLALRFSSIYGLEDRDLAVEFHVCTIVLY